MKAVAVVYSLTFLIALLIVANMPLSINMQLAGLLSIFTVWMLGVGEPLFYLAKSSRNPIVEQVAKSLRLVYPVRIVHGRSYYAGLAVGFLPRLRLIIIKDYVANKIKLEEMRALMAHEAAHLSDRHPMIQAIFAIITLSLTVILVENLWNMLGWILLSTAILLLLMRFFEIRATQKAVREVGLENYRAAIESIDAIRGKGSKLVRWWYSFTHPPV